MVRPREHSFPRQDFVHSGFRLRDFVIRDFVIRDSDRHPSRVTRRNARSGVSVSSDVAEEDDLGHCSPPRSPVEVSVPARADGCVTNPDLDAVANWQRSKSALHTTPWQCRRLCQTAATCAAKTSSLPSSVSLHEDVFQSEKGEPKAKQAVPSQNDDAEEQVRSVKQTGSRDRADGWISELTASPQATLLPAPPSWLREIAPAVNIQPFVGDPLQWDMFISSFKSLVHDVVGSDAQRLAILR
ncbi:hypothetical protein M513_12701 [Trichuris suis]|uniref:Uncharacterized protein n=1 Tax=Trichuris suis TaxID=68888 RepID=A0A085LN90_9BILA|nr:hypothetical protein M513_12701 [Trichuris suis]